ncbi:MAG: hypothetical protein LUC93_16335 [Planctomycetaceae bacterium]|nr:hypothetical protein [Planctomycetaceae bacterium]
MGLADKVGFTFTEVGDGKRLDLLLVLLPGFQESETFRGEVAAAAGRAAAFPEDNRTLDTDPIRNVGLAVEPPAAAMTPPTRLIWLFFRATRLPSHRYLA